MTSTQSCREAETVPPPPLSRRMFFSIQNRHLALYTLLTGLLVTAAATMYVKYGAERLAEQEFNSECIEIKNLVTTRLYDHARILRSGAAFFNATDMVTREKWRIFTRLQKIEQQLPGIQGIGFSLLVPRKELARHTAAIRREGFPLYRIKPEGDRSVYSSIIYLEPFSGRNLRAFGYDMLSEPVRQAAMERARDMDAASLSGKVVLVQESGQEVQAGTLMYIPVYRKNMPTNTPEERRAAIYGWIYSPYRMNDLMRGILGSHNMGKNVQFHIQLFDGERLSPSNMLYEFHPAKETGTSNRASHLKNVPIDFNGQRWTLLLTQSSNWPSRINSLPIWLTMFAGISTTLLLSALVHTLQNTRMEAIRLARELTKELRQASDYNRSLIEASIDPMVTIGQDGKITDVNQATVEVTGASRHEIIGTDFSSYFTDPHKAVAGYKLVLQDGTVENYPLEIRHRDGHLTPVLYNASVYRDANGNVTGVFAAARDITERRIVEAALSDHVQELKQTLDRVKQLEGIIPICMYCKKIRDDQNGWNQLEQYISDHSDARFSHGVCPHCAEEQLRIINEME